jgi:signal transduction histidine kinase/ActR/RegA family two-component response regulator
LPDGNDSAKRDETGSAGQQRRRGIGAVLHQATVIFGAYTVLYLAWSLTAVGLHTHVGQWVDALAYLPLNVGAAYWLIRSARREHISPLERTARQLMAAMYVCTIVANVILAYDAIERSIPAPDSWGNFIILFSYALGMMAVVRFPTAPRIALDGRKFALDFACIVISLSALAWTFLVAPIHWAGVPPTELLINLSYPVACITALAFLGRMMLQQSTASHRRDVTLLAIALFLQIMLDMVLSLDYQTAPLPSAKWVLLLYPFTYVVLIQACATARPAQRYVRRQFDLALHPVHLLPTLCAIAVYVVLVWAAATDLRQPLIVLVACSILLNMLFLAKQTIAVRESVALQASRADTENRERYEALAREGQKLEAVGRLAGGIAHDFNNLLTIVLANSEMALRELDEADRGRDEMADIREAALRGAELVRQLLAFSRKSVVAPVRLHPDRVVRDMERLLQRLAGDACPVRLDLPSHLGAVEVDRGQLEQVLANLVSNARDASPAGGTIAIGGENVTLSDESAAVLDLAAGNYVALWVQDAGVGIAEDVRSHIFEPFFTTKERGKGSGLGLASTYGIIRQSNGSITVDSTLGRGSRFRIYLPRFEGTVAMLTPLSTPIAPTVATGHGEKILLVEDVTAVRNVTRRMLAAAGYDVIEATDAAAARALLAIHGNEIALMITDIMMPGESGVALASAIREHWPDIRVQYISGYSDAELPETAGTVATDDLLQKPFSSQELLRCVDAHLLARTRHLSPSVARSR